MQRIPARGPNHPLIIWAVFLLCLTSLVTIICASILLIIAGHIVALQRLDMVLALSLLSGLVMCPTNTYMLYVISKGEGANANVLCCPLWLSVATVILINFAGACLCIYKIIFCWTTVKDSLLLGMQYYRSNARYKHFMDSIQWAGKCCGLDAYTDWFTRDWYDIIRDYDWEPFSHQPSKRSELVSDSVPLSCCKTGSCVSNYLTEMGTLSIHTSGCVRLVYFIVMTALVFQLMMFLSVIIVEVAMVFLSIVNFLRVRGPDEYWRKRRVFRLTSHYIGRRRNCYSIAVRNVHRALAYTTKARELKKQDMKDLWNTRITAACEQHNITHFQLKEGLDRANIMLDRKSLSNLASWEPRTFESLAAIAKEKLRLDGFVDSVDKKYPTGVNLNLKDVMLEAWLKENK